MIKYIYGNWDSMDKKYESFDFDVARLSVPMSLHSQKENLGLSVVLSAAAGSYTESIGPVIISRMHPSFVLLDLEKWALCFAEPLQEVGRFFRHLIGQKTPVLIRLKTPLGPFFDGTMEKKWIDQVHSILERSQVDSWEYVSVSFAHPYHNYYTSKAFIKKVNDSYQTMRAALVELLGAESSRIRLLTELPLESTQRKLLIQEGKFDGIFFPNASLYANLFRDSGDLLSKKTK